MPRITSWGLLGKFCAVIGLLIVVAEVGLHFLSWYLGKDYEMNHFVVAIGAVLGFWGFWTMDPKKTEDGAHVLSDLIPGAKLFGRRKSDAVAVPEVTTVITAKPVTPPEEPNGEPGK